MARSPNRREVPTVRSGALPEVAPNPGASRAGEMFFGSFAAAIKAMGEVVYPVMADERKREGEAEAAADVEAGTFARRAPWGVRDREYNRAGFTMAASEIETGAIERILDLSKKHRANPAGFGEALRAYATGAVATLGGESPALATAVRDRIIRRGMPFMERLGAEAATDLKDKSDAALFEMDRKSRALVDDYARNLFDKDAGVRKAAATAIASERADLVALVSRKKADGTPVYKPADAAKIVDAFDARIMERAVMSAFDNAEDIAKALDLWEKGGLKFDLGGKKLDPRALLPEATVRRITTYGHGVLRESVRKTSEDDRKATRAALEASRARRAEYIEMLTAAPSATPDRMAHLLTDGKARSLSDDKLLTPADREAITRFHASLKGRDRATDRDTYDDLFEDIHKDPPDGTSASAYRDALVKRIIAARRSLSKSDTLRLIAEAEKRHKAATDESDADAKRYRRLLSEALAPSPGLTGLDSPALRLRRARALEEYDDLVEGGMDPKEAWRDVRDRSLSTSLLRDRKGVVRSRFWVMDDKGDLDEAASEAKIKTLDKPGTAAEFAREWARYKAFRDAEAARKAAIRRDLEKR